MHSVIGNLCILWTCGGEVSGTLTIAIADDHPMFRAAVLHALDGKLVGGSAIEAASYSALDSALMNTGKADLVLLDLNMPGSHGFSSLIALRGKHPELPVIVISSNDHPRTVRRSQQFGAAGFVSKSAPAATLREAVDAVMEGGMWFTAEKAEASKEDAALAARLAQLTPQQLRVLMLMTEGLLNKQIGAQLGLAENTVKIHMTAILGKLNCRSRTQAAVLVKSLDMDLESGPGPSSSG